MINTKDCILRRSLLVFVGLCLICLTSLAQNFGTWTWMKGGNVINASAVYGTQGVAAPGNTPPALYEPAEFTDLQGRFWIYGGIGKTSAGNLFSSGELWMFDPATNNWTWMQGTNTLSPNLPTPSYGVQGVPSPTNQPGSRTYGTYAWTDLNGNLWLFGGVTALGGAGNDLWKYDITTGQWTWMKGPNTPNDPGSYGVQGIPAMSNCPPARYESAAAWTDNNGDLWLYGGVNANSDILGDMWRYSISTNMWTWMSGSNIPNSPVVFGTQGVPSPSNTPGARVVFSRWKDLNGDLWLFSGSSQLATFPSSSQDFWKYSVSSNQWTWMSGSQSGTANVFSNKCSTGNGLPMGLFESRASWTDDCGRFWCFGGAAVAIGPGTIWGSYDVLWCYDPTTGEATWLSGSLSVDQPGNFGTQGVAAPTNSPPSTNGGVGFKDNQGNFWIFGGFFTQNLGGDDNFNCLWKYNPDPLCPANPGPQASFNVDSSDQCNAGLINFQASTILPGLNYHWDFGIPNNASDTASAPNVSFDYDSTGIYTVTLIVSGASGCLTGSDTASFQLNISSLTLPSSSFSASACNSYTAPWGTVYTQSGSYTDTLTTPAGCDSLLILNLTIKSGTQSQQSISSCGPFTAPGGTVYNQNTTFTSTFTGANNCDSVVTYNLTILPSASVNVSPSDLAITLGDTVQLNATGGNTYQWSPSDGLSCTNCPSPMASPQASIVYVVSTTNSSGCSDTASVRIRVDIKCNELFLPDIFTPNGDGPVSNEKLCAFSNCVRLFSFIIYNRWGEQVFETTDITSCWDGTYKGKEAQVGIYAYKLYAEQIDGTIVDKKGTITLIR